MALATPRSSSSSTELTGSAKLDEVTNLMGKLAADLQRINLLPHRKESGSDEVPLEGLTSAERDAILEQLKVLGRDPANADPIFTKEGIEVLTRHAFNSPSNSTSHKALRCLANAMLLKAETRQMFVDLGYESKACNKLKNDNRDDEFLVSRIIFLTTYDTNVDLEKLIDQYHIADNICTNISRHTKQYTVKQKKVKELDPMEDMALIETLKLLFNITHFRPDRAPSFSPAIPNILLILSRRPISAKKPLDPPIAPLVNSLINIPFDASRDTAKLFPRETPTIYVDRLLDILDKSVRAYADEELDQLVSPLLTLIRQIYEVAPRDTQKHMRNLLLPSDEDRKQVLGKTDSLTSRLLRLSTNPTTPAVRESISGLLFEMSGKDARAFVQNVGYGFASGFLFQHNVPMPENALEAWSTSGGNGSASDVRSEASGSGSGTRFSQESRASAVGGESLVNPITGQRVEFERKIEEKEMTREEKEREAERLFVLFERLKKTGVMSVKNPVETALHEGRFEELDDDADSD